MVLNSAIYIEKDKPALVLAPMEGVTDAPMRALLTESHPFSYCVSEFYRISQDVPAAACFSRHVPELNHFSRTPSKVPVQLQLLGGHAEKLALAAQRACSVGANAIDLNFGCPAPTVNRHDGGATLLKSPERIYSVVSAVRKALPQSIPVSAKLRLGWEDPNDIFINALEAERAGASWITIHARTKSQGYRPPAHWRFIGEIKKRLSIPVIANGDLWSIEDLKRCQEETDCIHFMLGRGALADPLLASKAARFLGLNHGNLYADSELLSPVAWAPVLTRFHELCLKLTRNPNYTICRFKQWLSLVQQHGRTEWIDKIKQAKQLDEIFSILQNA